MDTEKITINLGAVDLGHIDLLVEQGFYSNRSDFIRTAIRGQVAKHADDIKDSLKPQFDKLPNTAESEYSETSIFITTGIVKLGIKELEGFKAKKVKVNIKMVGMLIIDKEVSVDLAKETIKSVKVYGIIRCPEEVKKLILNHL